MLCDRVQRLRMLPLTAGWGWRRRGVIREEVEKGKEIDHHPPGVPSPLLNHPPQLFSEEVSVALL